METVKQVCVLEGRVLSCAMNDGTTKLQLQVSKRTEIVANGVEHEHPEAKYVNEQKMVEISPKQLNPALSHELRLTRVGDHVRLNVLIDNEEGVEYTLFNISEYSVPLRF